MSALLQLAMVNNHQFTFFNSIFLFPSDMILASSAISFISSNSTWFRLLLIPSLFFFPILFISFSCLPYPTLLYFTLPDATLLFSIFYFSFYFFPTILLVSYLFLSFLIFSSLLFSSLHFSSFLSSSIIYSTLIFSKSFLFSVSLPFSPVCLDQKEGCMIIYSFSHIFFDHWYHHN